MTSGRLMTFGHEGCEQEDAADPQVVPETALPPFLPLPGTEGTARLGSSVTHMAVVC